MVRVEGADQAQLKSYLYQADGVLIVSLKACEGKVPDALQNALWAAAALVEQALAVAENGPECRDEFCDGAGI